MTDIINSLAAHGGSVLLGIAALLLFIESGFLIGLFIPASSTVLTVGAVAGTGNTHLMLSAVALTAGTTAGSQLSFARHKYTRPARPNLRVLAGINAWAHTQFNRHPLTGSTLSHLISGARTIGPRFAATTAMPYRHFAIADTLAALTWVSALLLAGRTIGQYLIPTLAALAGTALLLSSYRRIRKRLLHKASQPNTPEISQDGLTDTTQPAPPTLITRTQTPLRSPCNVKAR